MRYHCSLKISLFQAHKNEISRKTNIDRMKTFDSVALLRLLKYLSFFVMTFHQNVNLNDKVLRNDSIIANLRYISSNSVTMRSFVMEKND